MRHRLSAVLVSALALLAGNGLTEARTAPRPEGRWSTAALSRPRSNPVAVAVGHQVLFAGGVVGDTGSPLEADVYDAAGQWTTSTLPRVRGSLWVGGGLVAAPLGPVALVVGPADLTNPSTPLAADRYDGTTGVWSTAGSLPAVRRPLLAATAGPVALVLGGTDPAPDSPAVVDLYDSTTGAWTTAAPSLAGAGGSAGTTLGGTVIFAGGRGYCGKPCVGMASAAVALYDGPTRRWATARLSQARWDLAATTVGRQALFAGGEFETDQTLSSRASDRVDLYDSATGQWSTASLSQPRSRLAAASVGTRALFAGGLVAGGHAEARSSDRVDLYDSATGQWSTATLSEARSDLATAVVDTTVLFAGGSRQAPGEALRPSDRVDLYDSATGQWSTAVLSQPRSGLATAVVGPRVLFAGGRASDFQPSDRVDIYDSAAAPVPTPALVHDERYFPPTGYRIDEDRILDFFRSRGGVETFGYPVSRTFPFLGCPAQLFQRLVIQLCPGQGPALLNLLDPELLPYTRINGSTFPAPDEALKAATPRVADPEYTSAMLDFVRATAPDTFDGQPVDFGQTFFDRGGLEVWGAPISRPERDPSNPDFIYQRFQRGIMHHRVGLGTENILLADYFKAILLARDVPADLQAQAQGSRYFAQYCPGAPGWLCRPADLPGTKLTFAFEPG